MVEWLLKWLLDWLLGCLVEWLLDLFVSSIFTETKILPILIFTVLSDCLWFLSSLNCFAWKLAYPFWS